VSGCPTAGVTFGAGLDFVFFIRFHMDLFTDNLRFCRFVCLLVAARQKGQKTNQTGEASDDDEIFFHSG
jgi:hypothetical protein